LRWFSTDFNKRVVPTKLIAVAERPRRSEMGLAINPNEYPVPDESDLGNQKLLSLFTKGRIEIHNDRAGIRGVSSAGLTKGSRGHGHDVPKTAQARRTRRRKTRKQPLIRGRFYLISSCCDSDCALWPDLSEPLRRLLLCLIGS